MLRSWLRVELDLDHSVLQFRRFVLQGFSFPASLLRTHFSVFLKQSQLNEMLYMLINLKEKYNRYDNDSGDESNGSDGDRDRIGT